ncbi:hypothetical protein RHSIM_Rhsim04G0031700 [Rhododendron simsii]|uniref:Uncharacterized protein n=1 Tax=Rhododendron simsii TaxID=118357 RepID=A0A834H130_RHOSS|nr:hypothetical protein RHSIM_Rhsim04G0031700 [Rhododendron simsii]
MRPAFLSHFQPYQLPDHHGHNVQQLHDQLLQGMIQFGPFDPLYQQHHFQVQEEPPHPLVKVPFPCRSSHLRWSCTETSTTVQVGSKQGRTESSLGGADHEAAAHCDHDVVIGRVDDERESSS